MSQFEELISEFESLVSKTNVKGQEKAKVTRRKNRVEELLAELMSEGMNDYDEEFAECRDIGHNWEEQHAEWEDNQLTRLTQCVRCGSERTDVYSRTGELLVQQRSWPEGYLLDRKNGLTERGGRLKQYWRAVKVQRNVTNQK